MPNLGTTEIIIIAVVVMVLFGAKKLPEASRSLGRSLRIFKAETKGLREDDTPAPEPAPKPTPVAEIAPAPAVPTGTRSVNGAAPVEASKQS
ncbi:Sec-independent protein translocase subunit TatA [Pseudofrankia asymbiotica]|uniref:Sec-independent protein translocase protein TatA n=1 Tax=Pseudofrankia asymbiotica TaxID=1834516 RepID=A0A1V2HZU6_9ACTN|nr:Sec-independent protein translocase subunit TatA [Pseudofrankia asymbiotica]ONH22235.1 Sec-independent protein translocase TatA [Pseudofrankia asymbiotica]